MKILYQSLLICVHMKNHKTESKYNIFNLINTDLNEEELVFVLKA